MEDGSASALDLADAVSALADCRYLVLSTVPWHTAPDGTIWLDALWHRDLVRHLDYISDLTVLAPRLPLEKTAGMVQVAPDPRLKFRALPWGKSTLGGVMKSPATLLAAWRAVRAADLVHTGVAGWPFSAGFFVNPLAVLSRKTMVIVIESAFWRLSGPGPHRRRDRLRASLVEAFARWSVRHSDLALFTHHGYRDSIAPGLGDRAIVAPATWIDAGDLIDRPAAQAAWDAKGRPVRLLLAARLVEEKGIPLLLDALRLAGTDRPDLQVDVIGTGPLRETVRQAASALPNLRLLDPVPYGAPFFALLGSYHAALVPSLSDEQPRILYDAAARAVPVIASDTAGHRMQVEEDVTGWRFAPANPGALLSVLRRAAQDPDALRRMGLTARERALGQTHEAMHHDRARLLARLWRDRRSGAARTGRNDPA